MKRGASEIVDGGDGSNRRSCCSRGSSVLVLVRWKESAKVRSTSTASSISVG